MNLSERLDEWENASRWLMKNFPLDILVDSPRHKKILKLIEAVRIQDDALKKLIAPIQCTGSLCSTFSCDCPQELAHKTRASVQKLLGDG